MQRNMQKAKNYRFFNIPKEYKKEDYKESVGCIIEKYSKINGLASIYNWGNPSTPGISDIDIIFVFSGSQMRPLPLLRRSFNFLNQKARYLSRHPFVFAYEKSFESMRYVYPDANFTLMHGRNIRLKNISADEKYYAVAALLNDIIVRHYPRDFLEQSISRRINVRDTLLRLNSLKYSIRMLEFLSEEKNRDWNRQLGLIRKLRKEWFKTKDFGLLASLNESAVGISMEIIGRFREFLDESGIVKINSGSSVRYIGIKNNSVFTENWGKKEALEKMSGMIKNRQKFCSILPIELSAQLVEYSRHNGLISRYIRSNISNNLDYQLKHKRIIEKRISILNKQAELANRLRHSDFAAYFDFGYRAKSGINNWILNILDELRF